VFETGFVKFPKKHYREYAKRTLVNKIGLPEDVAHLVNLLLKNKYISGQNIVIDGGGGGVN
jgi:NAD(P)-dependent dehydrogenase (short-subunit alcohol dehydrogenase family)